MSELYLQIRYTLPLWFVFLLTSWLPDNKISFKLRGWLAKFFIKKCGKNLQIGRDVTLLNPFNLQLGNDVYIAKGGWYNALGGLTIEDEVVLAPYVVISTLQHVFKNNSVRFGGSISGEVHIGKGTWIASHSSIKCNTKIGKGSIVAANASVVKDIPDNVIYGGVPAKLIKENTEGEATLFTKMDLVNNKKE
jgi:acetyltransferase-like isoleucine patch superfamily enzyme